MRCPIIFQLRWFVLSFLVHIMKQFLEGSRSTRETQFNCLISWQHHKSIHLQHTSHVVKVYKILGKCLVDRVLINIDLVTNRTRIVVEISLIILLGNLPNLYTILNNLHTITLFILVELIEHEFTIICSSDKEPTCFCALGYISHETLQRIWSFEEVMKSELTRRNIEPFLTLAIQTKQCLVHLIFVFFDETKHSTRN